MTNLDCNVVNCVYNDNNSCKLSRIDVQGKDAQFSSETSCGSFSCKDCGCAVNSACEAKKETDVCCNAVECRFNKDKHCSAKHIGIAGGHAGSVNETECASFTC